MLGYLALHGVVNYSFEREDGNKDMNLVFGVEKTIGSRVSIVAEYNVALNDNTGDAIGNGYGYFSCGIRFSAGEGFTVGLDLRDLLHNKKLQGSAADRGIYLEYVSTLF